MVIAAPPPRQPDTGTYADGLRRHHQDYLERRAARRAKVAAWTAAGVPVAEIARMLDVSSRTVERERADLRRAAA